MIPAADRPKSTLRAVIAFAKDRDRWPDAVELRNFRKRLGSRAEVQRQLALLRDYGLVELRGQKQSSRWVPTLGGFDLIGSPEFRPALEMQCARAAAATILSVTQASALRNASNHKATASDRQTNGVLEVYG